MDITTLTIKNIETEAERREAQDIRFKVFVEEQLVPRELELDRYEECSTHLLQRFVTASVTIAIH